MSEKIVGYTLLLVGLMVIMYSAFSVFQVFTNQAQPVQLFNLPGVSMDLSKMISGFSPELSGVDLPPMEQEFASPEMINQPLNLFAHVTLMGFIASIGFRMANLGVLLVRTITAHVMTSPLATKEAKKE